MHVPLVTQVQPPTVDAELVRPTLSSDPGDMPHAAPTSERATAVAAAAKDAERMAGRPAPGATAVPG
ncbi:MAG TPA: hypothetical protein VF765_19805 [Polyangiaceae bacterium]